MPARKKPTKRQASAGKANLAAAKAKKPCPVCGRMISGNNLRRHVATHEAPPVTHDTIAPTSRAVTVAVGELLQQYRESVTGKPRRAVVGLGRIGRGLPTSTNDPDVVERAVAVYDAELIPAAPSLVVELKLRQRRRDLADAAERLRSSANGSGPRELFVRHGGAWAAEHGIDYATFRDMGLPASLLRAAGIRP